MPKIRKNKKNVVRSPHFKRREEELIKDTTGIEALEVFKTSQKVGRRLSSFFIVVGTSLSFFSLHGILTFKPFSFSNPIFIGILGFLGVTNFTCGLLMMVK